MPTFLHIGPAVSRRPVCAAVKGCRPRSVLSRTLISPVLPAPLPNCCQSFRSAQALLHSSLKTALLCQAA